MPFAAWEPYVSHAVFPGHIETSGRASLIDSWSTMGAILQIEAFSTERFLVDHWRALIENADARKTLEVSLTAILTPAVLAHLPRALQQQSEPGAVSAWIQARDAESDLLAIQSKADEVLVGLVVLAEDPSSRDQSIVHVGYLIAEQFWGQGAATETLKGLVSVMRKAAPIRLVGGVDVNNPASERVLRKTGFARDPVLSTPHSEIYTLDIP